MANLEKMNVEELEALSSKLKADQSEIHAERLAVQDAISRRAAKDRADSLVADMSDTEREALAQAISASGISSGENVGVPGT